jgi:site-specific recombinase XerD
MPIESVSKILGHTNITTTQIYAKVTNTKLEHDISMFEDRVSGKFAV